MDNMVTISEERIFELLREESTLDSYRKALGEMHDKLIEIRRAMYALGRTDRARLVEIEKIINGNKEAK